MQAEVLEAPSVQAGVVKVVEVLALQLQLVRVWARSWRDTIAAPSTSGMLYP
jgi:hypothetical protein